MKVLQLITGLGQGGAEQIVLDLAGRLDPGRHSVSVCSIMAVSGDAGVYVQRLRDAGARVLSLGLTGKWQVGRAAALADVLRDLRPDVLHCHMFHANVLGRWIGHRAGVPHIIATVHIAERRWRPWRFWLERRTDRLGSITVCVSNAVMRFQRQETGLPAERFTVIPNGIDTARFAEPSRPRDEVRAELGAAETVKLIGSVGRLDPQKGYEHLVRAVADVARQAEVELVIAGDGPEMGRLRRLAAAVGCADRVRLLGRRTDVPDLLHAFDVFALPSIYEGLPLALIEAMAAGVPVVASAVDSIPEVLGDDGVLVPPGDESALAGAIRGVLESPDPDRTQRAQARAREQFDVSAMVGKYAELYDSLAAHTCESQPPSA